MALKKRAGGTAKKGGGVSWRPDNAVQTGLWEGGRATLSFLFDEFDYGQGVGRVPVLIVTYVDENGEKHEEPYGIGSNFEPSQDGTQAIPTSGQTGLPKNCNAILYMLKPLAEKCEEGGFGELPDSEDITVLDGIVADVSRHPVIKREFRNKGKRNERRRGGGDERDDNQDGKTIISIDEIVSVPWQKGSKAAAAKKTTSEVAEEVTGRKVRKPVVEDEDEPAPKGRKAKAAEPEDDEGAGAEIDESAEDALIEILEEAGEKLAIDDLEGAALTKLRGNPDRKAIAARLLDVEFLRGVSAVMVDRKGTTVELADAEPEEEEEEEKPVVRRRR
jgi:hypothetical protein